MTCTHNIRIYTYIQTHTHIYVYTDKTKWVALVTETRKRLKRMSASLMKRNAPLLVLNSKISLLETVCICIHIHMYTNAHLSLSLFPSLSLSLTHTNTNTGGRTLTTGYKRASRKSSQLAHAAPRQPRASGAPCSQHEIVNTK